MSKVNELRKYFILFLIFISYCTYSQNSIKPENLLIDMTIKKYSSHIFLRAFFSYSTAEINDKQNENYWMVSYLPSKTNFYFGPKEPCKLISDDLIYNNVELIGNHPVFWSTPNNTSNQKLVIETLEENECFNSLRLPYINDKAIVVYYVVRKKDMKIIRAVRTRKYWKIYKYVEDLD